MYFVLCIQTALHVCMSSEVMLLSVSSSCLSGASVSLSGASVSKYTCIYTTGVCEDLIVPLVDPRITTSVARRLLSSTSQGGSLSVSSLSNQPASSLPIPPPTLKRDLVHKMKTLRSQINALQPPGHCRIEVGSGTCSYL